MTGWACLELIKMHMSLVHISFSSHGIIDEIAAATQLVHLNFNIIFISELIRAIETAILPLYKTKIIKLRSHL